MFSLLTLALFSSVDNQTHFIVAYVKDFTVQNLIASGSVWNIMKGDWLDRCIAQKGYIEPRAIDFHYANPRTKRSIRIETFASYEEFRQKADQLPRKMNDKSTSKERQEFMEQIHGYSSVYHLFRPVV